MSRIGKKPIQIPEGVEVKAEGSRVVVKGPQGEIERKIRPEVNVENKDGQVIVSVKESSRNRSKPFWGLTRTLIFNMIEGVFKGHQKQLEIQGVGYRASLEGEDLVLAVGYSHPVKIKKTEGINFKVEKNIITVSGIDKEAVGQIAAKIRKVRKPEPYKGKGIRYVGEYVRRKVGKKAVGAE